MQIAQRAYTAQREATSQFEASKKELPLKTKTTTTHRTEAIKKMLSESGPESVLASKGKYSHTRTFAAGRDQRAVLAFSSENKRVDGFVVNKDQQLVPIKPYDLPKELQQILTSDAFEAFLNDVHARLIQLHNGDFRLDLHQGLKGGVLYSPTGDIEEIKEALESLSEDARGGSIESRIIIKNECGYTLFHIGEGELHGNFHPLGKLAFQGKKREISTNAAGGLLFDSTRGSIFGTHGYLSFRIKVGDKNYIVICAFSTGMWSNNRAKIEIRNQEGSTAPTGEVDNMGGYFSAANIHGGKAKYKECTQINDLFEVKCQFTNERKAYFTFTFSLPQPKPVQQLPQGQLEKKEEEEEKSFLDVSQLPQKHQKKN